VAVELSLTTSEVEDLLGLPSRRRSAPS
jgi:hypothetical protein